MANGAGGSAARAPVMNQPSVVFTTEDRTGTVLVAVLTETAAGNSADASRRRVKFDLVDDDGWTMADLALFRSYRMQLYNQSGGLYINQAGKAFGLLREATVSYVARSELERDLTVVELYMQLIALLSPTPPTH